MRNISLCVVCLYASKRLQDNWFKCINNFMIRVWKFEHIKTKQSVNTNIFHFMNRIVEWHANKDLHNFSYWLQFYFWRTKCLLQQWNNFGFFYNGILKLLQTLQIKDRPVQPPEDWPRPDTRTLFPVIFGLGELRSFGIREDSSSAGDERLHNARGSWSGCSNPLQVTHRNLEGTFIKL